MLGGEQIVGYVSINWDEPLPINSFRGQDPDQPVFGADLQTLVGFSVPGRGFEPLSSTASPVMPYRAEPTHSSAIPPSAAPASLGPSQRHT